MNVRQNTARTITIGPVLDANGDAKTDEVVASVKIHKNGGSAAALDASATLTHSQSGFYLLALTANDMDTLGCAEFTLNSGTNSMPPVRLNVLTQDAWDALHHASDGRVRANSDQIAGSATAATRSKEFWGSIESGTAQAGASTTITLESGESSTDDFYNGRVIELTGGTGAKQARQITDYNGTTKVATVDSAWAVNPDNTTTYQILGRIT